MSAYSTESPSIEAIEKLAKLLKEQVEKPQDGPVETWGLLNDVVNSIEAQMGTLKMGKPPEGLTEEVRRAWDSVESIWASSAGVEKFKAVLDQLLEPLKNRAIEIEQLKKEIGLRKERLETLHMLVELLDELN